MPPKYIILIYLVCSIMNYVHIYHICDGYFRYDVTSNVRIAIPEELEFPSMTMCVGTINSLKWTQMTSELRRNLLTHPIFPDSIIETMVSNGSFVEETLLKLSLSDSHKIAIHLNNNLITRKTIPEILNLTKPIQELYNGFKINGLFKEPNGSIESYDTFTKDMSDFQFTTDRTFLHGGLKCFTLNLRPDLHRVINLNDALNIASGRLLFWYTLSELKTRVLFHRKGYLASLKDPFVTVHRGHSLELAFDLLESILLKYPYKTNCRDYYSTTGLSSRKECREKCFKSKTVARFGYVLFQSHAFPCDDLHLRRNTNYTADITQECKLDCWQKECHSLTYTFEKLKEENLVNYVGRNCRKSNGSTCPDGDADLRKESDFTVSSPHKPFTRTEIQPAIPLVSFVTAVLSTFGFWMGLSVSGAVIFVRRTWTKALNFGGKIRSRQTLATQRPVNQRITINLFDRRKNSTRQSNTRLQTVLQQFLNSNTRHKLRTHHKRS